MTRDATTVSPFDLAEQIDTACNQFEAAWKQGVRPRLEHYLTAFEEFRQPRILRLLLFLELDYRRKIREEPRPDEYNMRFPGHEQLVDAVFSITRSSTPIAANHKGQ